MRLTRFFSLTLVASAFVILLSTSCKKSNSGGGDSVTATIGTTNFAGAHTQGGYSAAVGIWGIVSYSSQGKDTSGFLLTVPPQAKAGKTLSSDSTFLQVVYVNFSGNTYDANTTTGHATMTINTLDTVGHKIAGTFTATAYNEANANDSVLITNGKFSSSYIIQ